MKKNLSVIQDEEYTPDYETDDVQKTDASTLELVAEESDDNFADSVPVDDVPVTNRKVGKNAPSVSIVKTSDNRNNITFSKTLLELLDNPKQLQFSLNHKYLYVGTKLPNVNKSFSFPSGEGIKTSLYGRGLIDLIVDTYELDYSRKTSITFRNIEILTKDFNGETLTYAKIKMRG